MSCPQNLIQVQCHGLGKRRQGMLRKRRSTAAPPTRKAGTNNLIALDMVMQYVAFRWQKISVT
jgi:hypothetical protein